MTTAPGLDALARALAARAAVPVDETERGEAFLSVLDTLAVGHAARGSAIPARLAGAGVLSEGPADQALLAATTAHVLDYDDVQMSSVCHASAVIVPALLALRPRWPEADLAAAYHAGLRTLAVLARLLGPRHYMAGWHATATLGPFGAAAALVQLAGGDAAVLRHALALAACQAAGLQRSFGTDAKPLQAGLAAAAGVRAALWAVAGVQGGDVLAANGFLDLYGAGGQGVATLEQALQPAPHDQVSRKGYPCCYASQRLIAAAARLHAAAPPWQPGMRLRLRVQAGTLLPLVARVPDSANSAKFCGAYLAAAALIDGTVGMRHFEPAALARADIRACMEATAIEETGPRAAALEDGSVHGAVLGAGGEMLAEVEVLHFPGSPQQPLDLAQMRAKVLDCCGGDTAAAAALWQQARALVPASRVEEPA